MVIEQDESYQNKTDGPDPGKDAAGAVRSGRKTEFQPAGPASGDAQDGQGNVAKFDEQFVFDISQRVRVGKQDGAA